MLMQHFSSAEVQGTIKSMIYTIDAVFARMGTFTYLSVAALHFDILPLSTVRVISAAVLLYSNKYSSF